MLTQRHKKSRLEETKIFWENVMWTDETKVELFGEAHFVLFTEKEMRPKKTLSLRSNMVEVHRCFGVALLLLAPDALTECMAS